MLQRWLLSCLCCWTSFEVLAQSPQTVDPRKPAAISIENVPVSSPEVWDRVRQYQSVRAARFRGWAPDGSGMLIQTRFGNTAQLHRVYAPGGRREQISFFEEPTDGEFVPNDMHGSLLCTLSAGGSENDQVYALDRATYAIKRLTDGKSRNLLGPVRDDGLYFVVSSNQRNGRDMDLYLADPHEPGKMELLLQVDGAFWIPTDWSPDGSKLLINRYVSINETYPAILELDSKKLTPIKIPGDKAAFGELHFAADGKSIYAACDARSEFQELCRINLETMDYQWLSSNVAWDVEEIVVDRADDGTELTAFTVNENGASRVYVLVANNIAPIKLPLGIVSKVQFSPDGTRLGFTLSSPSAPADAYSFDLRTKELVRWTFSELGGLAPDSFVTAQQIDFPSFDGRKIPAYYVKPNNATRDKKAGVLINIHGGPESQYRPDFDPIDQFYLAELGIAVIRPNVRGSAGYGKTYLQLDNAEKREDSVKDIGALLDWIAKQPELDASKVAVIGGSYGGYMVLASLTHFSDRLKAGVDVVGIADFVTFLNNTASYRRDLRRAEYGDERKPEMKTVFDQISPLKNAHKIKTGLLVVHGKNDPRVPFSEAEQIAPKVRANGQVVWTVYADDEGHGFGKKANRDYQTVVTIMFLKDRIGK